jgi:hypothetical protein
MAVLPAQVPMASATAARTARWMLLEDMKSPRK